MHIQKLLQPMKADITRQPPCHNGPLINIIIPGNISTSYGRPHCLGGQSFITFIRQKLISTCLSISSYCIYETFIDKQGLVDLLTPLWITAMLSQFLTVGWSHWLKMSDINQNLISLYIVWGQVGSGRGGGL